MTKMSNDSNTFYPIDLVAPQGGSQPTYAYLLLLHSVRRMNEMSQQDIYPLHSAQIWRAARLAAH